MWKPIDKYHLRNGEWTIRKMKLANGAKYALWQGNVSRGYFDSANEAKQRYEELNK